MNRFTVASLLVAFSFNAMAADISMDVGVIGQLTPEEVFTRECPACAKILNHMVSVKGGRLSFEDKMKIPETSPNYSYRLALNHISSSIYDTLALHEKNTGVLLTVEQAELFFESKENSALLK
jgi:hypothetical protein